MFRRSPPFVVPLVLVVAAAALAGCGGSHPSAAPAPTISLVHPTPTRPVAPSPPPPRRSPLTGLPVGSLQPVVAVKVDNVGTYGTNGLDQADVVYCEEVEGGLTRLLAVFSGTYPTQVGPVRSARESDLELLGQYGRIALAFSGANTGVLAEIDAANVRDDSYDVVSSAYPMDRQRPRPYQFLADVALLAATYPGVLAHNIGFRFGTAPTVHAPGGTVLVRYPAASIGATFGPAGYALARNGGALTTTGGAAVTATNVLVQYVTVRGSRYVDHNNNPTPYSETVGSGQAVLLRGGVAYTGTWSRATSAAPTTWTATGGGALTLAPGRTWVLLVPVGSPVTIG